MKRTVTGWSTSTAAPTFGNSRPGGPGEGYTLLIGEEGGAQSYVVWTIEATQKGGSQLTITVHPYLLANLPSVVAFLPYRLWIRPKLQRYLRSVVGGFAHVASTGEAVPRNHFGRHSWFS